MKNIGFIGSLICLIFIQFSCQKPYPIESVTAMTEVFGDGQKVIAMIVEYETEIRNSSLSIGNFSVEDRLVTKVYANTVPEITQEGKDGRYVVIELSIHDSIAPYRRSAILRNTRVAVDQTGTIYTVTGQKYGAWGQPLQSNREINLIVDDFIQGRYKDPDTGETLPYNLFVPRAYDANDSYPLVLFVRDAPGTEVKAVLEQGLGAIIWATPSEQEKRPCFVLAPQYDIPAVSGDSLTNEYPDITIRLIEELTRKYTIDLRRLYVTGHSKGSKILLEMNIHYPDFFAASFLVAGQWDAIPVDSLADKGLWLLVSEGDEPAYADMNALADTLKKEGASVSKALWDGHSTPAEFDREVKRIVAQKSNVNYTVLKKGTVVPEGMKDNEENNHIGVRRIAYKIEGIRDWLFSQQKSDEVTDNE